MSKILVSIDGVAVPFKDAHISLLDYGFLFGDSVYEVLKTVDGKIFAGDLHLKRLRYSAEKVGIPIPWDDSMLMEEMTELSRAFTGCCVYLRFVVTRGMGPIFFEPGVCLHPTRIAYATELIPVAEKLYRVGVKLTLSQFRKGPSRHSEGSVKTGNYLDHVLPRHKALSTGYHDALMLNHEEKVTECTSANIFWFKDGVLFTPCLQAGVLNGVTRQLVILTAKHEGITLNEGHYTIEELKNADEVFMTSTTRDILPVSSVETQEFPVGPLTKALLLAFRKRGMR